MLHNYNYAYFICIDFFSDGQLSVISHLIRLECPV